MFADLCLVSGGLGPTHDDRTVELLAAVTGRGLVLDAELEREIEGVSRLAAERQGRPYTDFRAGIQKQASLPEGAISLGLAGTAPGIVLDLEGRAVVALPGPPAELQRLWPRALDTEPLRRLLWRTSSPGHRVLRFYGVAESAVAFALEGCGGEGDGLEATVCARDLEVHVDLFYDGAGEARAETLAAALRRGFESELFAEDERAIEDLVLALCERRGFSLATAESCTGGLIAARLTAVPGASNVFKGGVVAYTDSVKEAQLGVPSSVLGRHGAVSAETAEAMAEGARERVGADVAVAATGIAGPGGGSEEKPVGRVCLHASCPGGALATTLNLTGDRTSVQRRAAVAGLHLLRRLLAQNRHEAV